MRTLYSHCPNPDCRFHKEQAPPRWYQKWGYFKERGQHVPRYRCKYCRRSFSASTFKTTYRQKRPDLNEALGAALIEGIGIRPAARAFKVSKTTILEKLKRIGKLAEQVCREKIESGAIKTSYVQFDEMMAFERTQCLPITIALAVRAKTGEIISIRAGAIPCDTVLQRVSRKKFVGYRENHKEKTVRLMLRDVAKCVRDEKNFTIASDSWLEYPEWVAKELPHANYEKHSGEDLKAREKAMSTVDLNLDPVDYSETDNYGPFFIKVQKNGKVVKKAYDPLFTVNQKCMKLRASLSRLRRDYWGYSQKVENLQLHLWIFMALHNGWELPIRKNQKTPKTEAKVELKPDAVSIHLPNLDAPKVELTLHRRGVLMIPISFKREHGLLQKTHYRATLDPVRKVMALTFHDSQVKDSMRAFSGGTGALNINTYLRRNDLKIKAGRLTIQWDEKQQCAFVFFGDLMERKNI